MTKTTLRVFWRVRGQEFADLEQAQIHAEALRLLGARRVKIVEVEVGRREEEARNAWARAWGYDAHWDGEWRGPDRRDAERHFAETWRAK